jgi:uncharacterized Zn-finger protein
MIRKARHGKNVNALHTCAECSKFFSRKDNLHTHIRNIHQRDPPKRTLLTLEEKAKRKLASKRKYDRKYEAKVKRKQRRLAKKGVHQGQ